MEENQPILTVDLLSKEFQKDGKPLMALDDVTFDLHKGEILGVIGRNGSGKSTLLKVLSKITGVTSGEIQYTGMIKSIIEIGTGFHPDLSGKENVKLNAQLLGIPWAKFKLAYQDLVEFSGLEDFMDMPVKHYSSGMYLRLAFSVAFHSKIDILLLDEVLAVGDAEFRRKCYHKVRELRDDGTAIIFVSHQMEPVLELCDRCMWIDNGKIVRIGTSLDVIEDYLNASKSDLGKIRGDRSEVEEVKKLDLSQLENGHVSVSDLRIRAKGKKVGEDILTEDVIEFVVLCEKLVDEDSIEFVFTISNFNNIRVLTDSYGLRKHYTPPLVAKGKYEVICEIPAQLLNRGVYELDVIICKNVSDRIVQARHFTRFKVFENDDLPFDAQISTVIKTQLNWTVNPLAE